MSQAALRFGNERRRPYGSYSVARPYVVVNGIEDPERTFLANAASDWQPTISATLRSIRESCNSADWDGEDALAISDSTVVLAAQLLACLFDLLPKGTPVPDVIPEPDGDIDINWRIDADRAFSLSVGAHLKINFAGQFGAGGSVHAWQPIDASTGESLAKSLADVARYIERLFASTDPRRAIGGKPQ